MPVSLAGTPETSRVLGPGFANMSHDGALNALILAQDHALQCRRTRHVREDLPPVVFDELLGESLSRDDQRRAGVVRGFNGHIGQCSRSANLYVAVNCPLDRMRCTCTRKAICCSAAGAGIILSSTPRWPG